MENKDLNEIKEEIDFAAVIASPIRMFPLAYVILLISFVIGGAFYISSMDSMSDNNSKFKTAAKNAEMTDLATKPAVTLAGVDVKLVGKPTDELLAKGADLFVKNCVSCHGEKGEGNGVAGAGLTPKPRNFTIGDAWKNGRKISGIYKTLEEGIAGGGMASYSYLPVDDRFALVHYVRSFKKDDAPEITEEELSDLELTYTLSKGKDSKAQIPVKKATEIIIAENKAGKTAKISAMLIKVNSSESTLFNKVASNKERSLTYLMDNQNWKSSSSEFLKQVSSALATNGFNGEVLKLNRNDVSALHSYLVGLYASAN